MAALPARPEIQRLPEPYRDENAQVAALLNELGAMREGWGQAVALAAPWVQQVRDNPAPFWAMESLLREYPITRPEGLALMRLAEALLRVPDAETAIALTADQLGRADFDAGSEGPHKMLASLSAAAINLSKKFLPGEDSGGLLGRMGSKTVVAATVRAIQLLGRQFVLGRNIDEAQGEAASARREQPQLTFSYDMLGEGARTEADAERYLASYRNAIARIAARSPGGRASSPMKADGISIKLSALFTRYEVLQRERVFETLVPRVQGLVDAAAQANMNLTIDAEEVDRLELSLDVFEALARHIADKHPQWQGFGLAVQAYQTRARAVVDAVAAIARQLNLRFMVRLVKGAYWDGEIKRAQELGLSDYPVFTHKAHTDISYLACAQALLAHQDVIYPQFASHNAGTVAAILEMARHSGAAFEMQRLHGMGEGVYREVLKDPAVPCRVYAPVGEHRDLLAYLVRRLLENGANSSFVHQLADPQVDVPTLLACPLEDVRPAPTLPRPLDLYKAAGEPRANSRGADLAAPTQRAPLTAAIATTVVPSLPLASAEDVRAAMTRLQDGFAAWSRTPVAQRAAVLRRAADLLDDQLAPFCGLLVKEAHKTLADCIAEVREAVDFLRYYADEAEAAGDAAMQGRGVFVCISPWNFPLAIFAGQVVAALVAGNTVAAKPAEQTPAVAQACVELFYAAGLPRDALVLLNGLGETVGAALVAHPATAGVCFTGSTQVAKIIQKTLAQGAEPKVLIAETGGLNAMVVDSTALPEQVVDAVVQSAFRSAGQRCSALRLLCVHESVAEGVIHMIQGALAELRCGDPTNLATDVGPLIDAEAYQGIRAQVERLRSGARLIAEGRLHDAQVPNLLAPIAFELKSIAEVKTEIFGPVLHVVRWSGDPEAIIDQVNALGYGLTLGIQTRIDTRAERLADRARIGNVYVNRNIIGAVVGVQPFGGEGLSGTGPKAGGPNYLWRFVRPHPVPQRAAAASSLPEALAQRLRALQAAMPDQAALLAQAAPRLLTQALPGPTGERNELRLHARGHVVGFVNGEGWRPALALALLAGNQVTVVGQSSALTAAAALQQQFQSLGGADWMACQEHAPADWFDWVRHAALDAAFCAGLSHDQTAALLSALAARSGAIVPLVTPDEAQQAQQVYRFAAEQTLTVNTAAAGGNAALLAGLH
ncbi:L-glutamate gamma-semialdehyde dehydrogenase [Inhella gelatinilytica]|uniref:L-glutamate gamma-semialdehyde dehydrogenase n=1 Tax=Inhella gelatinilytica TaxID=2795030 RepID=UPI0035C19656